jgi:riboflavin transporter FmnP
MDLEMNTKAFAMSITFSVVAMVLNPAVTGIKIPSPFLTGLYYQVWDIPIIVAFLLLGFRYGVFAGVLNSFFLFAVFPGPSQPLYGLSNVLAQFSMMIGIYLAKKVVVRAVPTGKLISKIRLVTVSTVLGMLVRLPIMLAVMFAILRYMTGLSEPVTLALLHVQVIYILVISAYTIPVAFIIARAVNKNLKVGNQIY